MLIPLNAPNVSPFMHKNNSSSSDRRPFLGWKSSVRRLRAPGLWLGVAALAGSSFLAAGSLHAQNTELDVASGLASGSNLSVGTSYTAGTAPTATSDVTFTAANTYTPPYTFGAAITIGSLNDLSATAISLSGSTVTLAGGDSVSGSTGDLLFVAAGASLTDTQQFTLGTTGNFNVAGTATLGYIADGSNGNSSAPTGTSSNLIKTGVGTLILTANNTYTGGTTINGGTLQDNFGGQGYGALRGTVTVNTGGTLALNAGDALGYNAITAGNSAAQLTINGGTINISVNANEGFTANLTMTGGTFSSTGGGGFNINPGAANAPSINTNASATTAVISAPVVQRSGTVSLAFNVASGAAGTTKGSDLTISGIISGAGGGITKNGAGTMLLTAMNTYTGPTTVNAGSLYVSGSTAGGAVAVTGTGTTLGGTGTINGAITVGNGAILTAGNKALATPTVGILTTGALTLATGSTFNALVLNGTTYSSLTAVGTTALGGAAFSLSLAPGATFSFTNGTPVLQLINSGVSGTFTNTTYSTGGYTFTADYVDSPGSFDVTVAAVPEPSTWGCGIFMFGLAVALRRRKIVGWLRA